ncbi:hypothetical protein [Streptomyces sp. G-G2]|uniref:hypothetical protein n=1 Tax=Streptomyces sp. G-G2 TaxID=3046201 RepID=UPI0024BAF0A1|nr:hypothetical protein [Streptomyces sp. G-G2]MDJ0380908.1 hypothetical protein [Streptomyces sp. G-G2]
MGSVYEDDGGRPSATRAGARAPAGAAARSAAGSRARTLWVEEPARRRRMPDPVRTAAVRAVLVVAVTLTQATVAFLLAVAGSWLALPMSLGAVAGIVVATWGVLDVWITRQTWNQRYGVVSVPSSTARGLRRDRRRARRAARSGRIPVASGGMR